MAHVFEGSLAELAPWIRTEVEFVAPLSAGASGTAVRRIQEWLNLHDMGVVVDGAFGTATARAVVEFQSSRGLAETGEVDEDTFGQMVAPMVDVLRQRLNASVPLAEAIVEYARAHLAVHPREVGGPNGGPWVRLYMNGRQGEAFAWCAGFVTFLLEQATQSLAVDRPIPGSVSCDVLATQAAQVGLLLPEADGPGKLSPGCLFLVRRTEGDWTHTGVVTGAYADAFDTIEGNTNDAGQREGVEVCARTRAYPNKDFILL
jgi:peptidoglycan hydrolase-like protein with peptidoglycan-binding domain